ncbi:MAG: L,D-transpeptidase family protein [Eubacteriales bacterium]
MIGEKIKENKLKFGIAIAVIVVLVIAVVAYASGVVYYSTRFIPGTSVNGFACSGKTVDEAKQTLRDDAAAYELTILERENKMESISSKDIDLELQFDQTIDDAMEAQSEYLWFTGFFVQNDVVMEKAVSYDEDKLEEKMDALSALQAENMIQPEDAKVSDYIEGTGYEIVPEVEGTKLKKKMTKRLIRETLAVMGTELDLEANDCYHAPEIRSDDADLAEICANMNEYVGAEVTIKFGKKKKEVVDSAMVSEWLRVSKKSNNVIVDEDKVFEYVEELASKYDTIYRPHTFKTSNGETIQIENGDYGWWMNKNETTAKLIRAIKKHEDKTIHPVYLQKAASYGKRDYGNTYVEVDLGSQYLYCYVDGELVLTSYFVSGDPYTGHATPGGIYSVTYKQRNHRMVGADYDVFTYYWMPFNGNIGFHDATWRGSFGGSQYLGNGSHGCINMPYSKAQALYSYVEAGTPVICYY